jgi:hypothetical protein
MSDCKLPSPCDELLPLLLDELGLSATIHSAKNTTVPARSAISERDAGIARPIIGRELHRHECSRVY